MFPISNKVAVLEFDSNHDVLDILVDKWTKKVTNINGMQFTKGLT